MGRSKKRKLAVGDIVRRVGERHQYAVVGKPQQGWVTLRRIHQHLGTRRSIELAREDISSLAESGFDEWQGDVRETKVRQIVPAIAFEGADWALAVWETPRTALIGTRLGDAWGIFPGDEDDPVASSVEEQAELLEGVLDFHQGYL